MDPNSEDKPEGPAEIPIVGDVDDWEGDVLKALLDVPAGGECVFYIDSAGGSVYGALSVLTLVRYRRLRATAVVLGECSSAALLVFAACQRRLVTPYSTLLFHRMRWESDKRIGSTEAALWARHFELLEQEIDKLQLRLFGTAVEQVRRWTQEGYYATGSEIAAAGLAELLEI
ncbi:MAG: ATP-dependent Clp protease proteolytic subunit [Gemmataceae bacterium]|nr:ATP-dependent Clp protease proteolytic subunit [Gemmataceae bacterium]MDW8264669.1 ATP-dependent Clp protease proteolytic subunit [Gemmataceae bacterium]